MKTPSTTSSRVKTGVARLCRRGCLAQRSQTTSANKKCSTPITKHALSIRRVKVATWLWAMKAHRVFLWTQPPVGSWLPQCARPLQSSSVANKIIGQILNSSTEFSTSCFPTSMFLPAHEPMPCTVSVPTVMTRTSALLRYSCLHKSLLTVHIQSLQNHGGSSRGRLSLTSRRSGCSDRSLTKIWPICLSSRKV